MGCTLCNNEGSFESVSQKDAKSAETLQVSMCNSCGLVQQQPIPTADELSIYYSHNYRQDYKSTYTPKSKHIYRAGKTSLQRIKFLNDTGITNGTLMDIGAGGGEFVFLSGQQGFKSKGIEPNIGYSEYAQKEYGSDVLTGELSDVQGKYDVITIFHVLEHLPSPTWAFRHLHSLLNEKGKLFVEVPWIEAEDASPKNINFKAHIFYFSVETLTSCASQYFDVVKVDTSSNLRILFEARSDESPLLFPNNESVEKLLDRLKNKDWFEYVFKGQGYAKSIKNLHRNIQESKVKGHSPKGILDGLLS